MILQRIVNAKKSELDLSASSAHLHFLKEHCTPSERSFKSAISKKNSFILECKRASPSKGRIRENFSVEEGANAYAPFADAISVLTDNAFFEGSFEHLKDMRQRVDQPILCKDFFIDEFQIYMARYAGADAILLMLSVLDNAAYGKLRRCALELGMDCITEVHTAEEMARAEELGADIIGINNRNLHTLEVDLNTTKRLAPLAPAGAVLVSESGVQTRRDVDFLSEDVSAFLVGSSLMARPRLDLAVRELLFGAVKICGLKTQAHCRAAFNAGASFGGFIFVEDSPRYISPAAAAEIETDLPMVGVFQNAEISQICNIVAACDLAVVQLHGDEPPQFLADLREKLPNHINIWKAIEITDNPAPYLGAADAILFDSKTASGFGGTGETFAWGRLPALPIPRILAGGISIENIHEAAQTGAEIIDVNSSLEEVRGEKSEEKIRDLFHHLKEGERLELLR